MAGEPIDRAARLWAAEDRLLAGLESVATAPPRPASPTTADLHDYHRVKDALRARPFSRERFAWELAEFMAKAGITPEEFEEAARRAA